MTEEYEMKSFLTEVVVDEETPLIGKNVGEILDPPERDLDLVQVIGMVKRIWSSWTLKQYAKTIT